MFILIRAAQYIEKNLDENKTLLKYILQYYYYNMSHFNFIYNNLNTFSSFSIK